MAHALKRYFDKRHFDITSEPQGGKPGTTGRLGFVIQKHAASHLHYDFRLELDGTLKSWAVPKGPSLDPADKRMAVHVEDHPLDYANFEGVIPAGQYGAGTVIVWDRGTWEPVGDARAGYAAGKLKFQLQGEKLRGGWTLVRMHGRAGERQEPWLLIKERDDAARPAAEYVVVAALPNSVLSDRTIPDPTKKATATKPARAGMPAAAAGPTAPARADHAGTPPTNGKSTVNKGKAAPTVRSTLATPAGARRAPLPATLEPQLATLAAETPRDSGWLYEIKFDGYRLLARIDEAGEVALFTRNGNDWTAKLRQLAADVKILGIGPGWFGGEIVVMGANGAPDFNALQNAFDSPSNAAIQYFLFDVPFHAGHDLRPVPLVERRAHLAGLLDGALQANSNSQVRFSQDFQASPSELLQNACRMRLEGVIGKRADAPYVSKRSATWIKLKCTQRQEFVVGGYTDPQGARTGLGSLLLGIHDETGHLRFAGGVGSGFDDATLAAIREQLAGLATDATPFFEKPRDVRGHWVRPELVAEVSFGEWTKEGRVRHAVFHGLRTDKPAAAIIREQAESRTEVVKDVAAEMAKAPVRKKAAAAPQKPEAAKGAPGRTSAPKTARMSSGSDAPTAESLGVRISNPDRVIDASSGATKVDLVNHYLRVARVILPHLEGRPVSLVRAPAGIGKQLFFQRHADALKIADLTQLDPAVSPGHAAMIEIDSFTALVSAAQNNVVEFHTWNARSKSADKPDRMVFDLDPGEGVAWRLIQEGANLTRALLHELGLASFLKTSGGKGLHIVVPLRPKDDWDTVKAFSQAVVAHLAQAIPERFVVKSGPKNRVGRIFVDYLRNGFGATTACAWSARARAGLGVSVPCSWDELASLTGGAHWTIANVPERLEEHVDPWSGYADARQTLTAAMKTLAFEPA